MARTRSFLFVSFVALVGVVGCYNEPNTMGSDYLGQCPAGGSACVGEGSVCGQNTCHCGTWMAPGNPAISQECNGQQPPDTCHPGMACSGEGVHCGDLVCHCGMWMDASCVDDIHCGDGGSGGTGNTGGTGGSGNTGNSGGASSVAHNVHIDVDSNAYHVWCEGANIDAYASGSDTQVNFHEPWHSFGCDAFSEDGASYSCSTTMNVGSSLRFQCYMTTPGTETSGDNIRYVFSYTPQLQDGESFAVYEDNVYMTLPSQWFYLRTNLDPINAAENAQLDPR